MRILIDIGHPGHVHLFRPFAQQMIKNGHAILFTCREKEFEIELLKAAGFSYKSFGKKHKTIIGKIWGLIKFDVLEVITALKFKPDVLLSHGSPYAAHAAFLLRKKNIALEDIGNSE
jgi:predicted glycosyltransferase